MRGLNLQIKNKDKNISKQLGICKKKKKRETYLLIRSVLLIIEC